MTRVSAMLKHSSMARTNDLSYEKGSAYEISSSTDLLYPGVTFLVHSVYKAVTGFILLNKCFQPVMKQRFALFTLRLMIF